MTKEDREHKEKKDELEEPPYEDPMHRKVCFYCPVHNGIACLPAYEFTKPVVKCPVCGAELQFSPKDPVLHFQVMMWRDVKRMMEKVLRDLLGDDFI